MLECFPSIGRDRGPCAAEPVQALGRRKVVESGHAGASVGGALAGWRLNGVECVLQFPTG